MKTIINVNQIKSVLKSQKINEQTISDTIISNCYETIFDYSKEGESKVNEFFAALFPDQEIYIHSNLIQSFNIQDEEDGTEYQVAINENYVDAGSDDYCYSFTINY